MKKKIVGAEKDSDSINGIRRMPLDEKSKVEIEIISDEFSLEFFVNGKAASFLIYPDMDAIDFTVEISSESCLLEKSLFE